MSTPEYAYAYDVHGVQVDAGSKVIAYSVWDGRYALTTVVRIEDLCLDYAWEGGPQSLALDRERWVIRNPGSPEWLVAGPNVTLTGVRA